MRSLLRRPLALFILVVLTGGILYSCAHVDAPQVEVDLTDHPAEQISWQLYGAVLDLGPWRSPDSKNLESPMVVREGPDQLVMWYRGQTFIDDTGRLMRATSPDGLNWTRTGVVMEPSGELEGEKIDPMTIMHDGDTYTMWYGTTPRGGGVNIATSTDGITWTRHEDNPVFSKGSSGWERRGAGGQHSVYFAGDRYNMIYKGYGDPEGWAQYGRAVSEDGVSWRRRGRVISPQPRIGENTLFRNMFAFYHNDRHYVVHAMAGKPKNLNLRLLYSDDGQNWQRAGIIFRKGGSDNDYDAKWATSPFIMIEDGRVRMWYEGGGPGGRVRVMYAEADEAEFFSAIHGPD